MKRIIAAATCTWAVLTAVFGVIYAKLEQGVFFTLAVTFGTVFYHFAMRLFVGWAVPRHFDYSRSCFQEKSFEKELYKKLRVKKWKDKMPSYNPGTYLVRSHSLESIAETMCRNEVIHKAICVLSFVPILFSIPFGAAPVFIITSVFSCAFDMIFVIIQRYNRPRIIRLIRRNNAKR